MITQESIDFALLLISLKVTRNIYYSDLIKGKEVNYMGDIIRLRDEVLMQKDRKPLMVDESLISVLDIELPIMNRTFKSISSDKFAKETADAFLKKLKKVKLKKYFACKVLYERLPPPECSFVDRIYYGIILAYGTRD